MEKKEFLEVLRQSLDGEVSTDKIEQNVKYYDQYIGSRTLEEEATLLEELGNPRLIAKTIIETDKVSKQKNQFNGYQGRGYKDYAEEKDNNSQQSNNYGSFKISSKLTWSQKIIFTLIIIAVVIVLFFIGRFIIGFLFAFAVPIILVMLFMVLFKKRN